MKILVSFLIFFSVTLAVNVHAQIIVFKCLSSNDKSISIYQDVDVLTYKFGKDGSKPEIEVKRRLEELKVTSEIPIGTGLNSSLEFNNGRYSYTINESLNRINEEHESTAWLDVRKNGDIISSIDCNVENGSLSDINTSHK